MDSLGIAGAGIGTTVAGTLDKNEEIGPENAVNNCSPHPTSMKAEF